MSLYEENWKKAKVLAEACVTEPKFVRLMVDYEEKEPTEEEKAYLEKIRREYKDPSGMFRISNMICKVDAALAEGKRDLESILRIYNFLDDPDYLKIVFHGDSTSEEWKKRMALRDALKRFF